MIEASSNLNSFGLAGHVSPSEQLITLTLGQLQDLVQEATERATAPLEARLDALEVRGVRCREGGEDLQDQAHKEPATEATSPPGAQGSHLQVDKIVALETENKALKAQLESLEEITARERAYDRQRIARLEQGDLHNHVDSAPAPAQGTKTEARIATIKDVLKQRGSTTFKELERILGISPREMLRLTKRLDMRQYEIFRRSGDSREKVIRLRAQISN